MTDIDHDPESNEVYPIGTMVRYYRYEDEDFTGIGEVRGYGIVRTEPARTVMLTRGINRDESRILIAWAVRRMEDE